MNNLLARIGLWWFARGNRHRIDQVTEEVQEMDDAEKNWWDSEGIWGGIVAIVAPIAVLVGKLAGYVVVVDKGALAHWLFSAALLVSGLAGAVSVHGRVTATRMIKPLWGAKSQTPRFLDVKKRSIG